MIGPKIRSSPKSLLPIHPAHHCPVSADPLLSITAPCPSTPDGDWQLLEEQVVEEGQPSSRGPRLFLHSVFWQRSVSES